MKRSWVAAIAILIGQYCIAQFPKNDIRRKVGNTEVINTNTVVVFDGANYSGNSHSYTAGTYRLHDGTDLNDMISSIRVPSGMVAVLYENADDGGGYGVLVDLMEDVPDLSVYSFNDKTSYLNIFPAKNSSGLVWVRGKMNGDQYVAGHWERPRANGANPNGSVAVLSPSYPARGSDPAEMSTAPLASQAEIDEFNNVMTTQMGVAVLGGANTRPFYYHANQPNEQVYKYQKLIDASRLPSGFLDWAQNKLQGISYVGGALSLVPYAGKEIIEAIDEVKDFFFGHESTTKYIDCWYPVNEYKKTVCGKMQANSFICSQDYLHTKLTVDKDVNLKIKPDPAFTWALQNRWLKSSEQLDEIEGEVKLKNNGNTTLPHNPLPLQIMNNTEVCVYGPWMADILDIHPKLDIPLTDETLDLGKLDINTNNEIHPVNQIWYKKGDETDLISIADGNGYFENKGNGEIEASGLHWPMRYYIAFYIPSPRLDATNGKKFEEYQVNGVAFDINNSLATDVQARTYSVKFHGEDRIKVNDNSFVRTGKTHEVFFDKVRTRPDGSLQGYIVVETLPIVNRGGSINVIVNKSETVVGGTRVKNIDGIRSNN